IKADITINKNMVPFDDRPPMISSGIRVGTAAVTIRGMKEADMVRIVELIDTVLTHHQDENKISEVKEEVNRWMKDFHLYVCMDLTIPYNSRPFQVLWSYFFSSKLIF